MRNCIFCVLTFSIRFFSVGNSRSELLKNNTVGVPVVLVAWDGSRLWPRRARRRAPGRRCRRLCHGCCSSVPRCWQSCRVTPSRWLEAGSPVSVSICCGSVRGRSGALRARLYRCSPWWRCWRVLRLLPLGAWNNKFWISSKSMFVRDRIRGQFLIWIRYISMWMFRNRKLSFH